MEEWIVVYKTSMLEATIIKGKFESEDIPVRLKYEAVGNIYGITTDGLGEVKILVPKSFRDKAKQIIEEAKPE
ncbi:MAG TPA: DUF2007 domain-containing protein [bacterium (Candidatus Stahlbacteria)]|nr:DUF2007 domain-containing protein [Candidatus Stahlbacteria bacterium]